MNEDQTLVGFLKASGAYSAATPTEDVPTAQVVPEMTSQ